MLNEPKTTEHPPILVRDPFSGKTYDVLPFFAFLDEFYQENPEQAERQILSVIRYINFNFDPEWIEGNELKNNLGTLWYHLDFYRQFNERRRELEKERGAA